MTVPDNSNHSAVVVDEPETPDLGKRGRFGFALVLFALAVMMVGAAAPTPFYPVLAERLALSPLVMTLVFAVYALALLVALLTLGSISDHIGRKPVIAAGFVLLAAAAVLFWQADSAAVLLGARVLQGVASGVLLAALSAAAVDLEPPDRPGSATISNAVFPLVGLAVGALLSAVILDRVGAGAIGAVFGSLAVCYLLLVVAVLTLPETVARRGGALASLWPRVSLSPEAAPVFWRGAPAVAAGWATGGLYLALGPSIIANEFGGRTHLSGGIVVTLLAGTGAAAGWIMRNRTPRAISLYGATLLAVGTAGTLVAIAVHWLPAYYATIVIAGLGFGTAFFGVLRTVVPLTHPDDRAENIAAILVVSYLAFGIPTVIAGLLIPRIGLDAAVYGYGTLVILAAGTAALMRRFGSSD